MEHKTEEKLMKKLDLSTMIIPLIVIVALCAVFMLMPEQSKSILGSIRKFLGDDFGIYYVLLGVGAVICSLYMAFSKYGKIRLGNLEKPQYSTFQWGTMIFTSTMAADILLFQSDVVPVGVDQMQHLEITRDIAMRFNNIYGDVFTIPEAYIGKVGAKIQSLQDPSKKMSKSDENANASIYLTDDPDTIIRKFKRAVTDSEACIRYCDEQPGIKNLINIYSACTGKTPDEIVAEFDGKGYGEFKLAVGESVASILKPIQDKQADLLKNKDYVDNIIKTNAEKANYVAMKTLRKVQKKVGFPERVR